MLTSSDNNTAESLMKEIGLSQRKEGSTAAGTAATTDLLAAQHFDLDGVVIHDGSGLDPDDRATCRLLDQILQADGPNGPIAAGLPVAARTGTLRDRYAKSPAAGVVRAKTGTLRDVTALSGWIHTTKGVDLSFSVILDLGRSVDAADLRFAERVTEAALAYPETIDLATVSPLPAAPGTGR
jgi:D-alanyl-D-alanine carboxypeptidase/D-alanyl-D-alanine-endopeptidase (penicillin-binding protein 4)